MLGSEVLRSLMPRAKRALREALTTENPEIAAARVKAALVVMAYCCGKPRETVEVSSPEGSASLTPLQERIRSGDPIECGRAVAFAEHVLDRHMEKRLGPAGMALFKRVMEAVPPERSTSPRELARLPAPSADNLPPVKTAEVLPPIVERPTADALPPGYEIRQQGQGGRYGVYRDGQLVTMGSTRGQAWDAAWSHARMKPAEPLTWPVQSTAADVTRDPYRKGP